jgi:hypothetical protein
MWEDDLLLRMAKSKEWDVYRVSFSKGEYLTKRKSDSAEAL